MIKTYRKLVAFTPADILTMVYEEDCNRPKNRKKKDLAFRLTLIYIRERATEARKTPLWHRVKLLWTLRESC